MDGNSVCLVVTFVELGYRLDPATKLPLFSV